MVDNPNTYRKQQMPQSALAAPPVDPTFAKALDKLVALAKQGQTPDKPLFNPPDEWLVSHMPTLQDLPQNERDHLLKEAAKVTSEAQKANAEGKAAARTWPETVVRLDNGGLAFFSQLGVVRRPDLTQYFIDGFDRNRDALAFSHNNQMLFSEIFSHITRFMEEGFNSGDAIIQTDRQIGDAGPRSFHARQLFFGTRYLQVPYMWRQLTFDLPEVERTRAPDILEVSLPCWLEDLGLTEELKDRVKKAGLTQLVFKAPTKSLSLHLGFDYVGEHKMGPLSIGMFQVKQAGGVAIQAALSMARVRTITDTVTNAAMVTVGPSLHGKSTLTIMVELGGGELTNLLGLAEDLEEGIFPMNDDIVLLQPLGEPREIVRGGNRITLSHGIDGTENNFYAVPFGLSKEADPITYDVLRGTVDAPNSQEILENVPVNIVDSTPNYLENPVRNMRMILSRRRLLARKGVEQLLNKITDGVMSDAVHVPMDYTDRVLWQAVMRQNTVIAPLRRLSLEQYIRVLMYGEAVQMGAAAGTIGRPYVEYFSDPFIIGLEDENANLMYEILQQMSQGGMPQDYYVFNTGGIGADTNDEASGSRYKKIPKELTLMLQEAILREAVKFEYDEFLGSDVAVAIVNSSGDEVLDLRKDWLPREIYGEAEYEHRIMELMRRRFYGRDSEDKSGILRYTKVTNKIIDLSAVPIPNNERELAWLLSFYWHVDQAYDSISDLVEHLQCGQPPEPRILESLQRSYISSVEHGLQLPTYSHKALAKLGMTVDR